MCGSENKLFFIILNDQMKRSTRFLKSFLKFADIPHTLGAHHLIYLIRMSPGNLKYTVVENYKKAHGPIYI